MKFFLITLLLSMTAMASKNHICDYKLREKITLSVYNASTFVIRSNRLQNPAVFSVLDSYEINDEYIYSGDLGSPWMEGTSFILRVRKNSPFGLYTVIHPNGRNRVNIKVTCRSF